MKLINYILIGLMVIMVIFGVESLTISEKKHYQIETNYLNRVIDNAANDAVHSLKKMIENNYSLRAGNDNAVATIDAFLTSMVNAVSDDTSLNRQMLMNYLPFAVVIDDEGYSIFAAVSDDSDKTTYSKAMTPKIRFYYQLDNQIIYLNNDPLITVVTINDSQYKAERYSKSEWLKQTSRSDLVRFFSDPNYDQTINNIKRQQLIEDINYYVNTHNAYAHTRGIFYDFVFDDRLQNIDFNNITFLAGFQGMPITSSRRYDKLVQNGFTIQHQDIYIGFKQNGILYYVDRERATTFVKDEDIVKRFESKYDAVAEGFFPYQP